MDTHLKGKRFVCKECPESCAFKTESSLHNHVREKHKLQLRYVKKDVLKCENFNLETFEEFEECTKNHKPQGGDTCSKRIDA